MTLTLAKSEGIDFRLLHQAADRLTPKLRRTLLAAFENLPEAALTPLIAALEAGRIDEVMGLLATVVDPAAQARISGVLAEAFSGAANLQGAEFNLRFDIQNPRAVRWAEANAAKLVTSVDTQTRGALRDIVVRGIQDGIPPAAQAREIRQLIGLSRRDATAADNFFRGLMENATTEKQEALALRRFETYQRRLLRQRAETIARTETIRAANMGQRAAWDAAADAGMIDRSSTRIVWIATEDSRTCPICAVLDGETVGFEESFSVREQATGFDQTDGGFEVSGTKPLKNPTTERTPPAHPRCRCAVGLIETDGSEIAPTAADAPDDGRPLPKLNTGERDELLAASERWADSLPDELKSATWKYTNKDFDAIHNTMARHGDDFWPMADRYNRFVTETGGLTDTATGLPNFAAAGEWSKTIEAFPALKNPLTQDAVEIAHRLRSAVGQYSGPHPTRVWRGVPENRIAALQEAFESGGTMTHRGFGSSSINSSIGESFATSQEGALIEILNPTRGAYIESVAIAENAGEMEYLIQAQSKYKIVRQYTAQVEDYTVQVFQAVEG